MQRLPSRSPRPEASGGLNDGNDEETSAAKACEGLNEARSAGQGHLEANSAGAWEAVLETMDAVSRVIRLVLGPAGFGSEAEDIEQETIISAVRGIGRWNAADGPLVVLTGEIGQS